MTSAPAPQLRGPTLAVAAARSAATYLVISVYVIIVGPPGVLLAIVFGWVDLLYVLARGGVALGLAVAGIKYDVEGRGRLRLDRAAVYCANHESNVDAPLLFLVLHPRMRLLFKAEFRKMPILGRACMLAGFIPVERGNPEQSQRAVDQAAAAIVAGHSFLVFPEGTRSRTGELLPFKKGPFIMALKGRVPIVPVAIHGGRTAMAKGSAIIRPVTVHVRIGEEVPTTGLTFEDRDALSAEVRRRIERLLQEQV
ncbi:MAG: 1-acyl-sn-glycerol-3-phosphate acyltransferase [Acidobacteria bacterium]|nr:MAG: 1-acyl-sn-glycerol-3-phosphate acyltransferase [Acidobacteriota bacterium]